MFIGCTFLFLIIIIIVVVYDYYYLSSLLAEDWHFESCLSLDAVAEKNKLLLLILFHQSLDSEIFLPSHFPFFSFFFLFVHPSFCFVLFCFAWKSVFDFGVLTEGLERVSVVTKPFPVLEKEKHVK